MKLKQPTSKTPSVKKKQGTKQDTLRGVGPESGKFKKEPSKSNYLNNWVIAKSRGELEPGCSEYFGLEGTNK